MVLGQHWGAAIGAWVPLNELLSAVERELHIPSDEAARALRAPLETLRVHAEVTGWHIPTYQSRGAPIHADWTYRNGAFERRQVSAKGWAHVDWNNGTLDGFQVVVRWAHVLRELTLTSIMLRKQSLKQSFVTEPERGEAQKGVDRTKPKALETPGTGIANEGGTKISPHNGRNYRNSDALLVVEMKALIDGDKARSAEDAARAVVKRAVGNGEDNSRVKRLSLRYRETYPGLSPASQS